MKRLTVLFFALTIPVIIVAGPLLWAYEPGLPTAGQEVLDFYLDKTNYANADLEIIPANNPGAFTADLSITSYGDGSYFIMSHDSNDSNLNRQNVRPLPFPPTEVWCATITIEPNSQRLVLIALHHDLYKATWAVHDVPGRLSDKATPDLLTQVGCK